MLQVWARDPDRVRRGLLVPVDATAVLRENGVGTWTVSVEEDAEWSPQVLPGWGIVAVDDGVQFSGPVTGIKVTHSGSTKTVELTGVTDLVEFKRRVVYPTPGANPESQTDGYRTAKGPAEDLMALLVNENAGPTAYTPVRVPGLVAYTSQGRGSSTSINARFTTLLEELQTLGTVGGLVFDVVQSGADLVFTVRPPADKSRSVRFGINNGLGGYELTQHAPEVTSVLVAGQGEGAARTIKKHTQANGWGVFSEVFQDRRDTDDADELLKAGTETLAEGAEYASATFDVAETATAKFGTHYHLGDTVTVDLPGGATISDGVRVAEITWDEHGRDVSLTVGERSTEEQRAPAWVKTNNNLLRRVRRLEASQ